jgi:hypothetical protein
LTESPELKHKQTAMLTPVDVVTLTPIFAQYPHLAFVAVVVWCVYRSIVAVSKVMIAWLRRPQLPLPQAFKNSPGPRRAVSAGQKERKRLKPPLQDEL